jgi:hypothetical protein
MTSEERERMQFLCKRIVEEKDPETFYSLAKQLDDLLEAKSQRLHRDNEAKPD